MFVRFSRDLDLHPNRDNARPCLYQRCRFCLLTKPPYPHSNIRPGTGKQQRHKIPLYRTHQPGYLRGTQSVLADLGISGPGSYFPQVTANPKNTESYLGLLYTMDDVAVYGYIAASKMKIVLALSLSDTVVKDAEVVNVSPPRNFFLDFNNLRLIRSLPRTLTQNLFRVAYESVPHGISFRGREPFP